MLTKLVTTLLAVLVLAASAQIGIAQEKRVVNPCAARPPLKAKTAEGTVKAISDTSLVVEGKDKQEWTFAISGKVAAAAKKLKAGDAVLVSYTEADGKMTASQVATAKAPKK